MNDDESEHALKPGVTAKAENNYYTCYNTKDLVGCSSGEYIILLFEEHYTPSAMQIMFVIHDLFSIPLVSFYPSAQTQS